MPSPVNDPHLVERIYATIARKENTYDGIYYTCVHTTGIFCRPSCRSRTPKPQNVSFYSSIEAAREAGFRPCKRCRPETPGPDGPQDTLVKAAKAAIEDRLPQAYSLSELAAALHVSPFYLQRVFKRQIGCSPAEYMIGRRIDQAKQYLLAHDPKPVAEIARLTGFSSPAYFSSVFLKIVGVPPTEFRNSAEQ